MKDITIRFLSIYDHLKNTKTIKNPKEFALEIGVSTSLITEICKKRTDAGITPIQNLLKKFTYIDANWLLTGEGQMLKSSNTALEINTNSNYKELAEAREEIIIMKNEKIAFLQKEIVALETILNSKNK